MGMGIKLASTAAVAVAVFAAVACGQTTDDPTSTPVSDDRPGSIRGIVADTAGTPVAGMRVGIVSGTAAFPEIAAETDDEGHYQIGSVPPGTFQVAVHDRDGEKIAQESVGVISGATATLNFSIPAPATTRPTTETCREYLDLLVSIDEGSTEEPVVATAYKCMSLNVDSTAQYPSKAPSLTPTQGLPLSLRLRVERKPVALELRLYSGAGIYGSFHKWPEELFTDAGPVDSLQPTPSLAFLYLPQQPPGEYSLVVRATWDGPIDVFYATSFRLQ